MDHVKVAILPEELTRTFKSGPASAVKRQRRIEQAVLEAGATLVPASEANAIVWLTLGAPISELEPVLDSNPAIKWVQLPSAGIESVPSAFLERDIIFTCAKGAYSEEAAEHALLLTLGTLRSTAAQIRKAKWSPNEANSLYGKRVTVLGAGGIATEFLRLIAPFGCTTRVLRRSTKPAALATETLQIERLHDVLAETDVLVLALSLTARTHNIIGETELGLLPQHAVIVNVARGALIDTDALVDALTQDKIAGAGLDVTAPEPLPDEHPLWQLQNVIITSHSADSTEFCTRKLAGRVASNIRHLQMGEPLDGVVDPAFCY